MRVLSFLVEESRIREVEKSRTLPPLTPQSRVEESGSREVENSASLDPSVESWGVEKSRGRELFEP
jgi:hypothetical protein